MSDVTQLLDDLIAHIEQNPKETIAEVVEKLVNVVKAIPIAANLGEIQRWSLLQGLLYEQDEILFFRRMKASEKLKQNLALHCLKYCGLREESDRFKTNQEPQLRCVFFESGSTIAHVIGLFAEHVYAAQRERVAQLSAINTSESLQKKEAPQLDLVVNTNNLTALTALAGLISDLEPTQGRLSFKYFGFFPFADDDSRSDWRKEGKRYISLANDISDSDLVFATCSSFSLLSGPLVGSRANAITKRAMYSGVESWDEHDNRRFYLLFHIKKYVPFAGEQPGGVTFDEPKSHCSVVFTRPDDRGRNAVRGWLDDLSQDDGRSNRFRGSWHERSSEGGGVRDPIVKFRQRTRTTVLIPNDLETSWLEWCETIRGRQVSILIALPDVAQSAQWTMDFLRAEVREVNAVLRHGNYGFKYAIVNDDRAAEDRVVEITTQLE